MKTKITFLILLVSITLFGQNQKPGEIVISKEHLISILQKFKNQDNPAADKQSVTNEVLLASKTIRNDSVMQRVRALESELIALRSKVEADANRSIVRDTVFVSTLKTMTKKDTLYNSAVKKASVQKDVVVNDENKNYKQQLDDLNAKYDAVLRNQEKILAMQAVSTIAVPATVAVVSQKETAPVEKPIMVKTVKPISSLVVVADSTVVKANNIEVKPATKLVSAEEIIEAKFRKTQAQVFFDNNSFKISSIDNLRLEQIVKELNENLSLSVFLEGYSSKSGNAAYNNKLSLFRNNAVKQVLIKNGISVKRIFSQNHGVDTSSTNEASARRVDISFDVKD
jgi:outer membrane protein OmpA-like peptidoglycan-associated protein